MQWIVIYNMNNFKKPLIVKINSEEMLKTLANLVIDRILEDIDKKKQINTKSDT